MKNKFIFFIIFLFVLVLPVSYGGCVNNIEISMKLVSLDANDKVSYSFPDFREGDLLVIDKIDISNVDNCNISELDIKFQLINKFGIHSNPFCGESFNFLGIGLPVKTSYSIYRLSNYTYQDSNGQYKNFCPATLDEAGTWNINITSNKNHIRRILVNNAPTRKGSSKLFHVYTSTDLELKKLAKETVLVAIFFGIFSVAISFGLFKSNIKYDRNKNLQNQENLLISLLTDLSQVAKTSEAYKEVFISTIRNNQFHFIKIVGVRELFKNFRDYLNLIIKNNNVGTIDSILKNDGGISVKIENICKLAINKLEKEFDKNKKPVRTILPFFKIRQIDGNFYSLNLDRFIGKTETIKLKNLLINLTEVIEVINYQINFVNDKTYLVRKDSQGLYEWYNFYYKAFMNLHDLDEKLSKVLKELLESKAVKNYFDQKLVEIDKIIKNNKEVKEESLQNIEVLNRIYQRFKKENI